MKRRELATLIAEALFYNGWGDKAVRLQLRLDDGGKGRERDGGGWCFDAAIDQIESILREAGETTMSEDPAKG